MTALCQIVTIHGHYERLTNDRLCNTPVKECSAPDSPKEACALSRLVMCVSLSGIIGTL